MFFRAFERSKNNVNVSLPIIDAAKDWMRNQLMPVIFPTMDLTSYAQKQTSGNKELTRYIVDFLHPKLLEKILFEYLKTPSRSQIIVTRGLNRLSSIREAYRNKRFGATMG